MPETNQGILDSNAQFLPMKKALNRNYTLKYLVSYVEGKGLFSSAELKNNLQILQKKKNSLKNV